MPVPINQVRIFLLCCCVVHCCRLHLDEMFRLNDRAERALLELQSQFVTAESQLSRVGLEGGSAPLSIAEVTRLTVRSH